MKFSCDKCVFAEIVHGSGAYVQSGCKIDRVDKINPDHHVETNEDGKTHFVSNRFCNTYRPTPWIKELTLEEKSNLKKTVFSEIKPIVGFFILFDDTPQNPLESLERTLLDIKHQLDHKARYVVVCNKKVEYNQEIHSLFVKHFVFEETEYNMVLNMYQPDPWLMIESAFRHAKNGWIYVTTSGESIERTLMEKIHRRINIDMKRLVVVEPYKDMNGLIFQAAAFNFAKTDTDTDGTFIDKLKKVPTDDPDTIITWSTFNENYASRGDRVWIDDNES